MPQRTKKDRAAKRPNEPSIWNRYADITMFFQGKDAVHETMYRVVEKLRGAAISFAIAGGMAVNAHRYKRTTGDVDVLLTADGFAEFCRLFVGKEFEQLPGRARRFVDSANQVILDILVTGRFPGSGQPGPIAFPDPSDVSETINDLPVINLVTLVQLKLAARRYRDFGDVVELIRFNNLDESFADRLHESVRLDYIECLEEKRREDEYEARNG